ncbi:hypothetical protein D9M70_511230 [compost metagenome]
MAVIGDLQCRCDAGGAGRHLDVERPGRRAVAVDAEASGQVADRLRDRVARCAGLLLRACRRLRLARCGQQAHGKAQQGREHSHQSGARDESVGHRLPLTNGPGPAGSGPSGASAQDQELTKTCLFMFLTNGVVIAPIFDLCLLPTDTTPHREEHHDPGFGFRLWRQPAGSSR